MIGAGQLPGPRRTDGGRPGEAYVTGVAAVPNGTHDRGEVDLALQVLEGAADDAGCGLGELDGLYMPKPRPWTPQGFVSTLVAGRLGLALGGSLEVYTGGTSGGHALGAAVRAVRAGAVDRAAVLAVERNSIVETDRYFEYVLSLFDRDLQAPAGPTIPGVYAMSLQRYLHEYDVAREDIAAIVAKNRRHAVGNPIALFEESVAVEEILDSRPVAEPLHLYECPALCDGAAALVVTAADRAGTAARPVRVAGHGYHHAASHLTGPLTASIASFPAVGTATDAALADAGFEIDDLDVLEPYAPFPHVEAILTEELGLFDRGDGAAACARGETDRDGPIPVSPSGGCLGRGHPAMVSPLLNHIAAVDQVRGTAARQVSGAETVLTTSEHGHVDGVTATVFGGVA